MVRLAVQAGRKKGGQGGKDDRPEALRDIHQRGAPGGTQEDRQGARGKAPFQEGRDGAGHRETRALRNPVKEGGGRCLSRMRTTGPWSGRTR